MISSYPIDLDPFSLKPHHGSWPKLSQESPVSVSFPVLQALIEETGAGRRCVLCAVVRTIGSAPQEPGAALLVCEDRSTVGTLGGGCVEAEVVRRAHQEVLSRKTGVQMHFTLNSDWGWDDGLICGGQMDIAAMALGHEADLVPYIDALAAHSQGHAASFPLRVEQDGGQVEYRIHLEEPPPLLIAGAGHVGQALARLAVDIGFAVTVIDDRPEYASTARLGPGVQVVVEDIAATLKQWPIDPRHYIVIVTRGHKHDETALESVIHSSARYIGLIGSRRKKKLIWDDLLAAGVPQEKLDRVHSPIGLNIEAVTVPEIAVSIAAELIQIRRAAPYAAVEGPFPL
jgi:xanthine dehydrogenase accessory factor